MILIDFDKLELRNLNRIVNSTLEDAKAQRPKVFAFADAVTRYRGKGVAVPVNASISTREAVLCASQADVMFSCVDTLEARQIADLLGASFLIPLLDLGVSIPTRKTTQGSAIADVCGRIDYVNDMFVQTSGYQRSEAVGMLATRLAVDTQGHAAYRAMHEAIGRAYR